MDKRISRAAIFDAVNSYQVPGTSATLTTLKAVKGITVDGSAITVSLALLDAYKDREQVIRQHLTERIQQQDAVKAVDIHIDWEKTPQVEYKNLLPTVKRAIVVGSGGDVRPSEPDPDSSTG